MVQTVPAGPRPRPPVRSIRALLSGNNFGTPWANVLWFHSDGSSEVTHTDLQAACDFVGNAWGSNLISHMHTGSVLTGCHMSFYGADLDLLEADSTFALAGSIGGDAVPAQVAIGVSWQLTVGYKGGHPRSYLAGFPQTKMAGVRLIDGTYASSIAAGATTFLNNVNAFTHGGITELHLVCMSFVRAKAWRTPPVPITVHSAHVDPRVDTQRRRLGPDVVQHFVTVDITVDLVSNAATLIALLLALFHRRFNSTKRP